MKAFLLAVFALIALPLGAQSVTYVPPMFVMMTSASGNPPYSPYAAALGAGQSVSSQPPVILPMCSPTGQPPYTPCLFQAPAALTNGLLAYYPINEGSGITFFDKSGFTNNATLTNQTGFGWSTGPTSGACSANAISVGNFSGPGNLNYGLASGSASNVLTYMTVMACVKTSVNNVIQGIVALDNGLSNRTFQLRINNTHPELVIFLGGTPQTITGTSTVADGNTHEIAATYNGNHVCIYADGAQDICTAFTGTMTSTSGSSPVWLAQVSNNGYLTGNLWNVRIWNVPISAADIKTIYTTGN